MCGTLKFEGRAQKIGDPVEIFSILTQKHTSAVWAGLAQEERLSFWKDRGDAVPALVRAHSFFEGRPNKRYEFRVQSGQLMAILLRKDVEVRGTIVARAGEVKIITRAPKNGYERSIHNRWPVVLLRGRGVQFFTQRDAIPNTTNQMSMLSGRSDNRRSAHM